MSDGTCVTFDTRWYRGTDEALLEALSRFPNRFYWNQDHPHRKLFVGKTIILQHGYGCGILLPQRVPRGWSARKWKAIRDCINDITSAGPLLQAAP